MKESQWDYCCVSCCSGCCSPLMTYRVFTPSSNSSSISSPFRTVLSRKRVNQVWVWLQQHISVHFFVVTCRPLTTRVDVDTELKEPVDRSPYKKEPLRWMTVQLLLTSTSHRAGHRNTAKPSHHKDIYIYS
jgi:hypothetical protein